jgi:hypothetical protein
MLQLYVRMRRVRFLLNKIVDRMEKKFWQNSDRRQISGEFVRTLFVTSATLLTVEWIQTTFLLHSRRKFMHNFKLVDSVIP